MKLHSIKIGLLGMVVPCLVLLAWCLAAKREVFSPQLLPPPGIIFDTWWDMQTSGELFTNMKASLLRVAAGFLLGSTLGFLLGSALGIWKTVDRYLGPLFSAVRQIPVVGWLPFLIVILGIDELFKVVFIALGALIPMALKTHEGIRSVPESYLEVARVFEFGRFRAFSEIILPCALPSILVGLRLSLSEAWMLVVGAELVAASVGIGNTMTVARRLFQTDVVLVSVIVIGLTGFFMDKALRLFEGQIISWRRT